MIHGIFANVGKYKQGEFRALTKQLHGRVPPRPKSEVHLPDETIASFDKLLHKLVSANIAAKV